MEKLKKLLSLESLRSIPREKLVKLILPIGILGMLLILLSDLPSGGSKKPSETENFDTAAYRRDAESRLSDILSGIDGVGEVEIMLTLSGDECYDYAQEYKRSSTENAEQGENKYVLIDSGGKKEALVRTVDNPTVSGVVIVCEGGDNSKVCERVYRAVSTAFDIPTNKIYVTKLK